MSRMKQEYYSLSERDQMTPSRAAILKYILYD